MKHLLTVSAFLAFYFVGAARAEDINNHYDGVWTTILSCSNTNGALGYSFKFPSTVRNGELHGERGVKDKAGWLRIDGKIVSDGSAALYVDGLVGAAQFAVGQRPAGTEYGYHIDAKFSDTSGGGSRVEGRPCNVTFAREK